MQILPYFFVALLGLVVGSFLNVVVLRLNTGRSIFKGRSQCLSCSVSLKWYELLPVVSFIAQRGKCHHCHSKISWQYIIVELITAGVFVLIASKFWPGGAGFLDTLLSPFTWYATVFSILIAISVYDLRHKIIPDVLVYIFIGMSVLTAAWYIDFSNFSLNLDILAGPIFFAFFAFLWLISMGKWMGFGDAKLSLGIGLLLGWGSGLAAEAIGFWIGALVGIVLLLAGGRYLTMKHEIPLAPFLVVGTFLAFILDLNILDWIF
ncbi:MAG TPA: prepilin peptidase [Candidatus Paceibacterota bacterium]